VGFENISRRISGSDLGVSAFIVDKADAAAGATKRVADLGSEGARCGTVPPPAITEKEKGHLTM
jgi:hypothetical protein